MKTIEGACRTAVRYNHDGSKDFVPLTLSITISGEKQSGKSTLLRKIEALLDAEGLLWVRGENTEHVESISIGRLP